MNDIRDNAVRLNEFDQDEWRDWILKWNPGVTAEQFDATWDEFVALKVKKKEH